MKYPLASDASSEAVSKQPVSQCSESVYEEAPAVGPDEDDEDNGQNTELADHLLKEDGEKDALWEEVDGAAIKKEWKQRGSCGGLCSCPEVSRVWKGDEGLCERVRGRASQELFSSRQCYIYLANGVVNELYIYEKGNVVVSQAGRILSNLVPHVSPGVQYSQLTMVIYIITQQHE
jgi:hypothetical protein